MTTGDGIAASDGAYPAWRTSAIGVSWLSSGNGHSLMETKWYATGSIRRAASLVTESSCWTSGAISQLESWS